MMTSQSYKITLLSLFFCLCSFWKVAAFYGNPENQITIPSTYESSAINVKDKIYLIGGYRYLENTSIVPNTDVSIFTFTPNGTLQTKTISPKVSLPCLSCAGYALPDGDTLIFANILYPTYNTTSPDNTTVEIFPGGLGLYHMSNNSWTYGQYSNSTFELRVDSNTAISVDKKFVYIAWGYDFEMKTSILKYEINNSSNIKSIETGVGVTGGCSVTLPTGVMVVGFGDKIAPETGLYNTTQVMLFDTNTDTFSWKSVKADRATGRFPTERVYASCTLGPDNSSIYYYGGSDQAMVYSDQTMKEFGRGLYNVTVYNDIAILDTKNWVWVLPKDTPGVKPLPTAKSSMALFDTNKLFISTGIQGTIGTGAISVLSNISPSVPSNDQADQLKWFTNDPKSDETEQFYGLSNGAIAGIIIAILIFLAFILILLWIYVPAAKKIAAYIQQDLIWNPRSGEPLWAETTRLLVRFILLFLFLAFIAYVIWKSVNSATVSQHTSIPVDSVLAPDIRFCFNGFDQSSPSTSPFVTCTLRNGTNCSGSIRPLDLTKQRPNFTFANTTCFLFLPGPSYRIYNDVKGFRDKAGTKLIFDFFAQNSTTGVVLVDFYAPGYDPNTDKYGFGKSKLTVDQIEQWAVSEQANNAVDTITLKQTVFSTASYTLTTVKTLRENDGWNYIGFSSNYDEYLDVSSSFKEIPQNPLYIPQGGRIAQLTVQPSEFTENSDVDQRVFTLLNAFAQAGGVLGLFVALQTILFGFRPQSPWGIVHRWSFGKLRIQLTDRLANYFDRTGTPVPLVNPVNHRFSTVNGQTYFKNTDDTYLALGVDTPSANESNDLNDHESRVHRVEERLQLMELLLKSYYLNDEVFRSLDQAVKRGNEERRRNSYTNTGIRETDSVLNEELKINSTKDDVATDLNRRPSSTVFPQQREQYEPRLAPNPTEFPYGNNEHGTAEKK